MFFRFLARELAAALAAARVEKIFLPAPNVVTVALYPHPGQTIPGFEGQKTLYLHARYGTGRHFLFLCAQKTAQPDRAPATAMRLRKYWRGKRISRLISDWPERRLTLVPQGDGPALVLDPRSFPTLTAAPASEKAPTEPVWPELTAVLADPEIWRKHPQLSPELRRRLAALPPEAAAACYARLENGTAEGYYLEEKDGQPRGLWPIDWPARQAPGLAIRRFDTALAAAAAFGEPLVFGEVAGREAAPERTAHQAGLRRLSRALAKLEADEARMRTFLARRQEADILAAHLHAIDKTTKITELLLPDASGVRHAIRLDPALTVVQNMQKLYHFAAKGERGLAAIASRRRDLQDKKKDLQGRERVVGRDEAPARTTPAPTSGAIKGVAAHIYRTTDGFVALRGKNAKANDQLLRLASPFDFWFHVADGPGAHVILRRDHPGREVPQRSLEEAAGLAALASFASQASAADVLVAAVRDVRRIKGAPAGQVTVDTIMETIRVRPDPTLEKLRDPSKS